MEQKDRQTKLILPGCLEKRPAEPTEQGTKNPSQFVRMGTRHSESERLIVRTASGSEQALEPNLVDSCDGQPRIDVVPT